MGYLVNENLEPLPIWVTTPGNLMSIDKMFRLGRSPVQARVRVNWSIASWSETNEGEGM
jgi:hypothetical protein